MKRLETIEVPVPPLETQRWFDRLQAKSRRISPSRRLGPRHRRPDPRFCMKSSTERQSPHDSRAVLTRINGVAVQGRTGPILSACEADGEEEVEVFVKLSAGCDQGVVNLAREAIAASLAADLGLPVPKPWIVEIPPEIIPVVADAQVADKLRRSCPVAFGSTRTPGFSAWTTGQRLSDAMRPVASGILLFDAIIQNPDRRRGRLPRSGRRTSDHRP